MASQVAKDVPDILKKILTVKVEEISVAKKQRSFNELDTIIKDLESPRGFKCALENPVGLLEDRVIAEIKKASPSKGVIREDFNPALIAAQYEKAGARCLSCLTDEQFFKGHAQYLKEAREACSIPVLRKDFMIEPYHIAQSRAMGADCILLIVAALDDVILAELYECALHYDLDVLIEVHDENELERAQKLTHLDKAMIGVNNRDLRTFKTDLMTSLRIKSLLDNRFDVITESGIHTKEDVMMMRQSGIGAFLVGEAFMRAQNPGAALHELFGS